MMMIPVNTNVENSQNRDRCQIEKNQVEPIDVNLNSWQSSIINSFRNFIGIFLSIQIFKHLFAKRKTASELLSLLCCPPPLCRLGPAWAVWAPPLWCSWPGLERRCEPRSPPRISASCNLIVKLTTFSLSEHFYFLVLLRK